MKSVGIDAGQATAAADIADMGQVGGTPEIHGATITACYLFAVVVLYFSFRNMAAMIGKLRRRGGSVETHSVGPLHLILATAFVALFLFQAVAAFQGGTEKRTSAADSKDQPAAAVSAAVDPSPADSVIPAAGSATENPESQQESAGATSPNAETILSGALLLAGMAGLVIVFYRASGQSFSAAVGWHRYRWRESGAAGLLLLPATLVLMFVALAATAALSPPELAVDRQVLVKTAGSAVKDGNFSVLAAVVVTAVVIAPLAEEALFRGFLYPVAKRYLHPAAAALIVSLLFGFAHSPLIVVPSLALLGVVLIIVYEATGSLRVPIILHGLFNGLQLGFIVLKGGGIA